jgi:ribosome-binding factor A
MPSKHQRSSGSRQLRIADQIQRDLAELIQREIRDSRISLVTLTSVELTADYAHAKVYFTTLTDNWQDTQQALNDKAGYLHSLLYKLLHIHTVPTLHFVHDSSVARGVDLSRLIDQANATSAKD